MVLPHLANENDIGSLYKASTPIEMITDIYDISTYLIITKIWPLPFSSNMWFWCESSGLSVGAGKFNFVQWRYSNQWSNREVLLLLVENYNQYPAPTRWNTLVCGNFWPALRSRNMTERLKRVLRWDRLVVGLAGHRASLLGLLAKIKV